jgi:hypothetical protein
MVPKFQADTVYLSCSPFDIILYKLNPLDTNPTKLFFLFTKFDTNSEIKNSATTLRRRKTGLSLRTLGKKTVLFLAPQYNISQFFHDFLFHLLFYYMFLSFLLFLWGKTVKLALRPLLLPTVAAPDDDDCGTFGGMQIDRGNRSTRRKPAPVPLCLLQIPRRRLTA